CWCAWVAARIAARRLVGADWWVCAGHCRQLCHWRVLTAPRLGFIAPTDYWWLDRIAFVVCGRPHGVAPTQKPDRSECYLFARRCLWCACGGTHCAWLDDDFARRLPDRDSRQDLVRLQIHDRHIIGSLVGDVGGFTVRSEGDPVRHFADGDSRL